MPAAMVVWGFIILVAAVIAAVVVLPTWSSRKDRLDRSERHELAEKRLLLKQIEKTVYRDRDVYPEYSVIIDMITESKMKELD